MKKTRKQLISEAPKYGLHLETLGWLANEQPLIGCVFTQYKELAMQFAEGFDYPPQKLGIWNAQLKRELGADFKFEAVYL